MPEATVRHRFMMGMTLFKVELRGFEPLTSAVQRRLLNVAVVRGVQKYLQISIFYLVDCRGCSPLFAWLGVKLVSTTLTKGCLPASLFSAEPAE